MSRVKRLQMEREPLGDVGHLLPSVQVKCGRVNRAPSCFTSLMGEGVPRTQANNQSRWRTGPISQNVVLVLVGNRTAHSGEATFLEK